MHVLLAASANVHRLFTVSVFILQNKKCCMGASQGMSAAQLAALISLVTSCFCYLTRSTQHFFTYGHRVIPREIEHSCLFTIFVLFCFLLHVIWAHSKCMEPKLSFSKNAPSVPKKYLMVAAQVSPYCLPQCSLISRPNMM